MNFIALQHGILHAELCAFRSCRITVFNWLQHIQQIKYIYKYSSHPTTGRTLPYTEYKNTYNTMRIQDATRNSTDISVFLISLALSLLEILFPIIHANGTLCPISEPV